MILHPSEIDDRMESDILRRETIRPAPKPKRKRKPKDILLARPFVNRLGLRPGEPSILQIQQEVCERHKLTLAELLSPRRHALIVACRHEAMWECTKRTSFSLPVIGKAFRRDHTVVLYAAQKLGGNRRRGIPPLPLPCG